MTIYDRVKELADAKRMSISELERTLKLSNGSLSKWATAKPNSKFLEKVADFFGVSTDYLLGRQSPKDGIQNPRVKRLARRMESQDEDDLNAIESMLDALDKAKGLDGHHKG